MSYIKTVSPKHAEGAVLEMYERQQRHWGYVPNYAKSFSHRPEVMARWGRLLAEIRRPLDDRMFELVTFAAAIELRHTSCSLAHGKALTRFFSDDEVRAIPTLCKCRRFATVAGEFHGAKLGRTNRDFRLSQRENHDYTERVDVSARRCSGAYCIAVTGGLRWRWFGHFARTGRYTDN
jgi:hypothetical protein